MGMYTEMFFAAEVDAEAAQVLQGLYESGAVDNPPHRFFVLNHARMLLGGWSAYSNGGPHEFEATEEEYAAKGRPTHQVTVRSSFKNYEDEAEAFLEYITPFVVAAAAGDGGFVGYTLYEADGVPTLHFVRDGQLVSLTPASEPHLDEAFEIAASQRAGAKEAIV